MGHEQVQGGESHVLAGQLLQLQAVTESHAQGSCMFATGSALRFSVKGPGSWSEVAWALGYQQPCGVAGFHD